MGSLRFYAFLKGRMGTSLLFMQIEGCSTVSENNKTLVLLQKRGTGLRCCVSIKNSEGDAHKIIGFKKIGSPVKFASLHIFDIFNRAGRAGKASLLR